MFMPMKIKNIKNAAFYSLIVFLFFVCGCNKTPDAIGPGRNFYSGYPAFSEGDVVNCVIEIPAGSNEKWEVNPKSGDLERCIVKGKPRVIKYALAYPFNYGMIPQTKSGDGDPVDIVVLGNRLEQGSVRKARVIGSLQLIDKGEVDYKILAVPEGDHIFKGIVTLQDLDRRFPQATDIVKIWFRNYKSASGSVEVGDFLEKDKALEFIKQSVRGRSN